MVRRGCRRAFTLIELLVVVAIIAVLISILLPSLAGARKQARQLLCNTNLRSMGQAAYQYAHENKELIIRAEYEDDEDPNADLHFVCCLMKGLGYDGSIRGLWRSRNQAGFRVALKKMKILQCPDFPVPEQDLDYVVNSLPNPYTQLNAGADETGGGSPGGDDSFTSEGENALDSIDAFKMTDFPRPSTPAGTIYLTEAHRSLPSNTFVYHNLFLTSQLPFGAHPRISNDKRHPGGVNALFFDGHAETMPWRRMDVGWPRSLAERLRYFALVPPELN